MKPGIAWIIGGGSGIGAAVAKMLAAQGWTVAISGRREDRLATVAGADSKIKPYVLDVTDREAVGRVIETIYSDLGRVDLFMFGAAAWEPSTVADYDFEAFAKVVDTNYLGLLRIADPLLKRMTAQGGGHFAVIASVAGYFGLPRSAAYSSTKSGLITLLETMRAEMAPKKVLIRMIAPGFVKSELTDKNDFPMPFLMETDDAAKRIVDGLTQSDRFEIAFPKRMVWLMKAMKMLPYPVFFWITGKMVEG